MPNLFLLDEFALLDDFEVLGLEVACRRPKTNGFICFFERMNIDGPVDFEEVVFEGQREGAGVFLLGFACCNTRTKFV